MGIINNTQAGNGGRVEATVQVVVSDEVVDNLGEGNGPEGQSRLVNQVFDQGRLVSDIKASWGTPGSGQGQ